MLNKLCTEKIGRESVCHMEQLGLSESEFGLMEYIWDNDPVDTAALVKYGEEMFSWNKSTTYTILKRLENKGFTKKERSVVSALIEREQVIDYETDKFVERTFKGSFPSLVSAFLGRSKISKEEAEQLINIINSNIDDEV